MSQDTASKPGKTASQDKSSNIGTGASRNGWITTLQQRLQNPRNQATWTIAPHSNTVVRISLKGLGNPLHKILGDDLSIQIHTADDLVAALDANPDAKERLIAHLEKAWASYPLKGAILLYPDENVVHRAYTEISLPVPEAQADAKQKQSKESDADENTEPTDDQMEETPTEEVNKQDATLLRSIDLEFVLNVLARARGMLLVADTELALEPGFLEQSFLCDDSRIIKLAQATGCLEESWATS